MTVKFPEQIDIFNAKLPNEVIRANHINILQDAITAIEIYIKNLNFKVDNIIEQGYDGYNINIDGYILNDIDGYQSVNNLYDSLILLKDYITINKNLLLDEINEHINKQVSAHKSESIKTNIYNNILNNTNNLKECLDKLDIHTHNIQDINDLSSDLLYSDDKVISLLSNICDETNNIITTITNNKLVSYLKYNNSNTINITESQNGLIFDVIQNNINHNNLQNIGSYTHQQIDTHINSNSNIHGVSGELVGTIDDQELYNKKIYSAFKGCKIILFTDSVEKEEINYWKNYLSDNDKEFEIRYPSITKIISNNDNQLTVTTPSLFNIGDKVRVNNLSNIGVVSNINNNILTINFNPSIGNIDLSNKLLINTEKESAILSFDYINKELKTININVDNINSSNITTTNINTNNLNSEIIVSNIISTNKINIKEINYNNIYKKIFFEINMIGSGVYNIISTNTNSIKIDYEIIKNNITQKGNITITKQLDDIDYIIDYIGDDLGVIYIIDNIGGILNVKIQKNDNIYTRAKFFIVY